MKIMTLPAFAHRLVPACVHVDVNAPPSSKKPEYFVRRLHHLLLACNHKTTSKHHQFSLKLIIKKIHEILYGNTEILPDQKARHELTVEMFFKESPTSVNHPFRLMITCFNSMHLESQKYVTEIVAHLLGRMVNSRMIACEFLEQNLDIIDVLIKASFDFHEPGVALLYGFMLRASIRRSEIVARHVLESDNHVHVKKFLEGAQHQDFTIASYVMTTFEFLLTDHMSTVADFLLNNTSEWFFDQFKSKLLESSQNVLTRFHALKIMGDMLTNLGKDDVVLVRFLSSEQNMKIVMNMMKEVEKSSKCSTQGRILRQNEKYIQAKRNVLKIFKLFVENQNKTETIVKILSLNKEKMCKFLLEEFKIDDDEQFVEEKTLVIRGIEAL